MKNLLPMFFALLILSSCKKKEEKIAVQSVTIDNGAATNVSAANVHLGATLQLTATVLPDNATSKEVTWASSDPSTATVSEGLVTPVKEGETVISATAGGVIANCKVTVLPPFVAVAGISLTPVTVGIVIGKTSTITATVAPNNAYDKKVVWSSDKKDIATVNKDDGVVTAVAEGTCLITAKSVSDSTKSATCEVTVVVREISPTGISVIPESANILVNATRQLRAKFTPENVTNKTVAWSSSDAAIAEISPAGLVTAKSVGSATITVSAGEPAKTATCAITVTDQAVAVTGLTVAPADTTITATASCQLRCRIEPGTATNMEVTYESNDPAKAIVSESGLVTANVAGEATITVKSVADITKMGTCRITIKPRVESITVSPDVVSLLVGQKQLLTVAVMPSDAGNKTVTWKSLDESKATVSNEGEVTAVALGEVRITATAKDGSGIAGSATVTVRPAATSLTIAPENPTVLQGETLALRATILPAEAAQAVTWSSGDLAKATINANTGVATGVGVGTALITATAADGSVVKAEITLTVQPNPNASNAAITAISLGAENFVAAVPDPGATTTLNNAPRTIAGNLAEVQVNITATVGAVIKIGETIFTSEQKLNLTNSVTFSVTQDGKVGSKEYTLTITPYNKSTNPYGIYTTAHLHDMRNAISEGFKLMNDLTMPAASAGLPGIDDYGTAGWLPIGNGETAFTGSLDGEGFKIDNFFTKRTAQYAGLFGKVGNGTIKNLGLNGRPQVNDSGDGASMGEFGSGVQYTGILAGLSEGTIEDCFTSGYAYATGDGTSGHIYAGGLVGYAKGQISRCHATGRVLAYSQGTRGAYGGGIAGFSQATISDCYATGNIYAMGSADNSNSYAGGLIGECTGGSVSKCYATGTVYAQSASTSREYGAWAGGLIGSFNTRQINNCYARGKATATGTAAANIMKCLAGGFIGQAHDGSISNSYSVGAAEAKMAAYNFKYAGGFVGYSNTDKYTNCYRNWDASVLKDNSEVTSNDNSTAGISAEYLVDMKKDTQRNNLNQGQSAVWGRAGGKNDDLPYLIGVGVGKD